MAYQKNEKDILYICDQCGVSEAIQVNESETKFIDKGWTLGREAYQSSKLMKCPLCSKGKRPEPFRDNPMFEGRSEEEIRQAAANDGWLDEIEGIKSGDAIKIMNEAVINATSMVEGTWVEDQNLLWEAKQAAKMQRKLNQGTNAIVIFGALVLIGLIAFLLTLLD